jgi:hypothetical protein
MSEENQSFLTVSDIIDALGIPAILGVIAGVWNNMKKIVSHEAKISILEEKVAETDSNVSPMLIEVALLKQLTNSTHRMVKDLHREFYKIEREDDETTSVP